MKPVFQGKKIHTPFPLFLKEGILQGRFLFEAPRGRNFIPTLSFIHPPHLEGFFQGSGGGGLQNLALYGMFVPFSLSSSVLEDWVWELE